MDKYIDVLTLIIGGLVGYIGQLLVARYAKSKQERQVDVAQKAMNLSKMTVDELTEKMALIGKLDDENRGFQNEIYILKQKQKEAEEKRKDRDAQLEAMEAHLTALQTQIDKDASERADLRAKLAEFDTRYRVLYRYLIALLEHLKRHAIDPVPPPKELESDPEILKFINNKDKP